MIKPESPCLGCIERAFNCRGKCSEWEQYLKDRKKWSDEVVRNKDKEYAAYAEDRYRRGQR